MSVSSSSSPSLVPVCACVRIAQKSPKPVLFDHLGNPIVPLHPLANPTVFLSYSQLSLDMSDPAADDQLGRTEAHVNGLLYHRDVLGQDRDGDEVAPYTHPDMFRNLLVHYLNVLQRTADGLVPFGPERQPQSDATPNPRFMDDVLDGLETKAENMTKQKLQQEQKITEHINQTALFRYVLPSCYSKYDYYGALCQWGNIQPQQVTNDPTDAALRSCTVDLDAVMIPHNKWKVLLVYPYSHPTVFEFSSRSGSGFTVRECIHLICRAFVDVVGQHSVLQQAKQAFITRYALDKCPNLKLQTHEHDISRVMITGIYRPRVALGAWQRGMTTPRPSQPQGYEWDDEGNQKLESHQDIIYRVQYTNTNSGDS